MNALEPAMVLPSLVEEALSSRLDDATASSIRCGFEEARQRPVTLRANTLLATRDDVASALTDAGIAFDPVPWYEDAFILRDVRERAVWDLAIYQEGKVYVQGLSSMLPPLVLAPRAGADVLDMCAAPGGKTAQMAALTKGAAHLTACELKAPRAEKLTYNLDKLGVRNVQVMRVDARKLDEFFSFDQVLLDAPCSGSGTLRAGDGRAIRRVTPQLLAKVTRSQRALLDRALTVLKPGGTLVYSTCSVLPHENDEQVVAALKRHRDCELVPLELVDAQDDAERPGHPLPSVTQAVVEAVGRQDIPRIETELPGTLTVCPSRLFEGFYVALITKTRSR